MSYASAPGNPQNLRDYDGAGLCDNASHLEFKGEFLRKRAAPRISACETNGLIAAFRVR